MWICLQNDTLFNCFSRTFYADELINTHRNPSNTLTYRMYANKNATIEESKKKSKSSRVCVLESNGITWGDIYLTKSNLHNL